MKISNIWDQLRRWEGLLFLILVVIIINNTLQSPYYLQIGNQISLFQLSIEKIIIALVTILVILNAKIDLSVASIMRLTV